MFITGMNTEVNNVDEVNPPITVIANPFEIKVPVEVVSANGSNAAIVANAVIKVGRRRVLPPSIISSRIGNCF